MFHHISPAMLKRMHELEAIDERDRMDGTPHGRRLRQIPPETGRFLALMAAGAPNGAFLEIGASAGYSSMWISLACQQRGDGTRLTTFELMPEKVSLARQTFRQAEVELYIEVVEGDVRQYLPAYSQVAFCFLDTEKTLYETCYEMVVPNMVSGGLLLADNVISHAEDLDAFLQKAYADPRLDALVVPIGKGVLVCRKT